MKLSIWDIAAGVLLIKESGGIFTNFEGEEKLDGNVIAGSPHIHEELYKIVKRTLV